MPTLDLTEFVLFEDYYFEHVGYIDEDSKPFALGQASDLSLNKS